MPAGSDSEMNRPNEPLAFAHALLFLWLGVGAKYACKPWSRLSLLIDLGGLVASLGALWCAES